jgi:Nif-specific regulatory protein
MVSKVWRILGRYRVLSELARGPESVVLKVEDSRRGGQPCAFKVLRIGNLKAFEAARREFEVLRKLRHAGIAEAYDLGPLQHDDVSQAGIEWPTTSEADTRQGGRRSRLPLESPALASFAYLTSAYYEGLDLRQAFLHIFSKKESRTAAENWGVFLEALARICNALEAVHSRGLIHFDIKPENLLLVPHSPGPALSPFDVKILDFGLSADESTPLGTRVRGTVPFIAPELMERDLVETGLVDRRSDLYSLGVTIFFAVTGQYPFADTTPREWLAALRTGRTVPLEDVEPAVPPELAATVAELLRHEPAARPATALSVQRRLERVGGFRLLKAKDRITPPFPRVGWERELAMVRGEIEHLNRGEAENALIIFEGDSDQFLDHLLDEVEVVARAEGASVITGSCSRRRAHPYEPFCQILDKVGAETDLAEPRFARYGGILAALLSRARLSVRDKTGTGDQEEMPALEPSLEFHRFLDLATDCFFELVRDGPLVLCIRDLHLAGRETLELLRSLVRNVNLRSRHEAGREPIDALRSSTGLRAEDEGDEARLLVVGTVRDSPQERTGQAEGDSDEDVLREICAEPYAANIRLKNLGLDRVTDWIRECAPSLRVEGDITRRLYEKSAGSRWLIDEFVLRTLGTSREGNAHPRGADAAPEALLHLPRHAVDSACERLQSLSAEERRLLEIVAVAHTALDVELLKTIDRTLSEADEEGKQRKDEVERRQAAFFASRLRTLEEQRFVHLHRPSFLVRRGGFIGVQVALSQPALAHQIYRQMDAKVRTAYHGAIARALLDLSGGAPCGTAADLAFHARLGGLEDLFFAQARNAAASFAAIHAYDAATRQYEEILEVLEELGDTTPSQTEPSSRAINPSTLRKEVNEELAHIHLGQGQLQKALEKLILLSTEQKMNSADLGAIYRRMGDVCQLNGDSDKALHFLEESCRLLHAELPQEPLPADDLPVGADPSTNEYLLTLLSLARYHVEHENVAEADKIVNEWGLAGSASRHTRTRCKLHILMARIEVRRHNHTGSLSENIAALELAETTKDLPMVLETSSSVGWGYLDQGKYENAIEHFEKGLDVAQQLESKHDRASIHSCLGTLYHNRADHRKALEHFAISLELSSQIGDLKGIANSYNNLGIVYRLKDDLVLASESYKRAIDLFSRINDQHGMAAGMSNLSSILELEGKYNEALDYSFRALQKRKKTRSRSGMAFSYYRIGSIYQSKGEIDKAGTYAEKSFQIRQELGESLGMAHSRLQLSELYLETGRYSEALELCETGLEDFESLENHVGVLVARKTLARILIRLGALEEAQAILEKILAELRVGEQEVLTGSCLVLLGQIAAESGDTLRGEGLLARAEKLFRSNQNRRELAEALLESAALQLDLGRYDRASNRLEEAYSHLEDLGVRDLVPLYFLLRGQLELELPRFDPKEAGKFLERGLVEAREFDMPDVKWRFHYRLGVLQERLGDRKLARHHFREATETLEEASNNLPQRFQKSFHQPRERRELRHAASTSAETSPRVATAREVHSVRDRAQPLLPSPLASDTDGALNLHRQSFKLHEIAAAMGSEKDLKKLLESIMDAVLELVDAERGFLILKRPDVGRAAPGGPVDNRRRRSIEVARNLDREEILEPEGKLSESVAKKVLRTGKPVLASNALGEERFESSHSIRELRLRSLVCVPLQFQKETLGAIYLDNRHRRDAFRSQDVDLLKTFADQAAVAVKNAQLVEENHARNRELTLANRKMESLNIKLRTMVHKRSVQLAIAHEDLRDRQIQLEQRYHFQNIVGKSEAMQTIYRLLEKVSATQLPVLLEGESGTGKELVARAIHFNSSHREGRFISQNCGAMAESLLETELFGHTKGAFTGAVSDKKGLFELADGGTLFLDEVDGMSPGMQQKVLRTYQDGELRRVGSKEPLTVNVRFIAASNKSLNDLVAQKKFREDLYYRISGVRIRLPALRERKEDIPLLVEHFVEKAAQEKAAQNNATQDSAAQKGDEVRRQFHPAAIATLMAEDWPGNIRELRHFVERTLLITQAAVIRPEDLLFDTPALAARPEGSAGDGGRPMAALADETLTLREARDRFEKDFLGSLLKACGGNVTQAARRSGISRESLYRLLRKHDLRQ